MQPHTQEYVQYLRSREWQAKRLAALRRTQNRCEKCGIQKHREGLQVHHKTYERLGHEVDSDLMVLCKLCHPSEDENRRVETAKRVYLKRVDGWASKKYGEQWDDYMNAEVVEEEFEEWLERNPDWVRVNGRLRKTTCSTFGGLESLEVDLWTVGSLRRKETVSSITRRCSATYLLATFRY